LFLVHLLSEPREAFSGMNECAVIGFWGCNAGATMEMAAHLTEIWKVISGGAPHACEKPKFLSPLTSTANVFDSPTDDGKG